MLLTQLGADENLSQGSILAITQDAKGFIWFNTENGLNRYDGYDLEHITHSLALNTGIPNNWVSALNQLIGAAFATDAPHFKNTSEREGLPNSTVYGIESDPSGHLWLSTNHRIAEAPDSITWERSLAFADAALHQTKSARNNWFGIAGTALAAESPKLTDFREVDTEAMQRQGIITVLKRDVLSDDTVDNMLARPRRDSLK